MFQNDDVKKGFNDGDFDDFIWPRPTSPPLISTGLKSSLHAASFLWWWEIPMIWVLRTTKDYDREEDKRNVDRWREGMLQGSCVRCRGSWSTLELLSFSQKHTGLLFFWPNPQHYIGKVTETQNPTFKKKQKELAKYFLLKDYWIDSKLGPPCLLPDTKQTLVFTSNTKFSFGKRASFSFRNQ